MSAAVTEGLPAAGTCRVVSTTLVASYQGRVEAVTDRKGSRRIIGFLSMVEADRSKQFETLRDLGSDISRYGASPLQPPLEILVASADERSGGGMTAYGAGSIGEQGNVAFHAQVACELSAGSLPTPLMPSVPR